MNLPSQDQIYSALRSVGITAGTIGTLAAAFGVMTPDQAAAFATDVQALVKDLTATFGDLSKLVLLLLPIITVLLAHWGIKAASIKSQIACVEAHPAAHVITTDPKLAAGIPGVQVVNAGIPGVLADPPPK